VLLTQQSPGNGIAVRTCLGMIQKRANLLVKLRADDVLELAGLRMRLGIGNGKSISEEALGEAVTPDNVAGASAAVFGEADVAAADFHQMQIGHAAERAAPGPPSRGCGCARRALRCLFAANPDLLEQMIEALLFFGGDCGDLLEAPVGQLDAAVGQPRDGRRVRHHDDGVSAGVQLAENVEDDLLVGLIEIAGGLVGEDEFRLIDQRAGMATRCCSPPESCAGRCSRRSARPTRRSAAAACSSLVMLWKYCASITFSSAVRYGTR